MKLEVWGLRLLQGLADGSLSDKQILLRMIMLMVVMVTGSPLLAGHPTVYIPKLRSPVFSSCCN